MKKAVDVKYPQSASLFQFCRRVLDHKFGGIRVIDQDVGQILGFDPADCSHWKKGKKNIRSIQAMKAIAEHLGVDEKLVVDVAAGELDDSEAFHEYCGYGAFDIDSKVLEAAKKDYYRKHAGSWTREKELEFKAHFDANEPAIDEVIRAIHAKINFTEAPLYLPEVVNASPGLRLLAVDPSQSSGAVPVRARAEADEMLIHFTAGTEMRPYVRYRLAKSMADFFLARADQTRARLDELGDYGQHVKEVQSNLFAAKLLAPASLLRKEMAQLNVAKDIISQLAETFWVSKTFMNRRLKDILERQPSI